ncbi:hypothetical protein RV12_GL001723 [Enterococcus quebecensis]|nr:hypothetical protein RV12_GL001723 [Enterococcus quebecensis]
MKLLFGGIKMGRKVFVSHCYKDRRYADIFVQLLKKFGFREEDIFYSSSPETGVKPGEQIFDRLKKELEDSPIVLYFLSDNYYQSVPCLNEMGASWITTDIHYPIALPHFSPSKIKGAIGSDRLALLLNKELDAIQVCDLVSTIREQAGVVLPDELKYREIESVKPSFDKLKHYIQMEDYLIPDEDGVFETMLCEERVIKSEKKDQYACFKLSKPIAKNFIDVEKMSKKDNHWLFFNKSWGNFESGDTVQFKLNEEAPYFGERFFKDIGKCKNIYVSHLEKIE